MSEMKYLKEFMRNHKIECFSPENYIDSQCDCGRNKAADELKQMEEDLADNKRMKNDLDNAAVERRNFIAQVAQLRMNFNDAILRLHEMMQDTPVHNQGYEAYQNAAAFLARIKEPK